MTEARIKTPMTPAAIVASPTGNPPTHVSGIPNCARGAKQLAAVVEATATGPEPAGFEPALEPPPEPEPPPDD
jgi:hypothetical protein